MEHTVQKWHLPISPSSPEQGDGRQWAGGVTMRSMPLTALSVTLSRSFTFPVSLSLTLFPPAVSVSHSVTLAPPLSLSLSLPPFLSAGDITEPLQACWVFMCTAVVSWNTGQIHRSFKTLSLSRSPALSLSLAHYSDVYMERNGAHPLFQWL